MAIAKTSYAPFKARLVMGSATVLKTKDHEGKDEPNENKHHWFMGFAVPKGPEWEAIWATMYNAAANDPSCTAALCGQAGFNWKTDDCDNPENPQNKGKASYPANHMLIKFSRYKAMGPVGMVDGNYTPIIDPTATKCGDYFYISGSTLFNGAATVKTNAGMYQNIEGLMFAASGDEIASEGGFDAKSAFAGVQGGQVVQQAQHANVPPAQTPPSAQTLPPALTPPPATDLVQPGGAILPPPLPAEDSYTYSGVTKTLSEWAITPQWSKELIEQYGTKVV